jgi:hypothetical protein
MPHTDRFEQVRMPSEALLNQGGIFLRLMQWTGLSGDTPYKIRRRITVIALLAWFPLLVLSAWEGQMLGDTIAVPFLFDINVHIRILIALPLLIIAEVAVNRRMPMILRSFRERHLIPERSIAQFDSAIKSSSRLVNSVVPELILIALVYGFGIMIVWQNYLVLDVATWYASATVDGSKLTLAGWWYGYVSVPIVQFLLFRWYWRLLVWARFLWQVSRIPLSLLAAHPDRAGGLGFLSSTGYALTMFAVAHGALAAGPIASQILFSGAALPEFSGEIGVLVIFVLCIVFGPLLAFAPQLAATKQVGLNKYGTMAERYVREFESKWMSGTSCANESLVGSADIQSLADLSGSFDVVQAMRIVPVMKQAVLRLGVATILPIVPLVLTMIPLNDLLKKLLGIVI